MSDKNATVRQAANAQPGARSIARTMTHGAMRALNAVKAKTPIAAIDCEGLANESFDLLFITPLIAQRLAEALIDTVWGSIDFSDGPVGIICMPRSVPKATMGTIDISTAQVTALILQAAKTFVMAS